MQWFKVLAEDAAKELNTDIKKGLTSDEASGRLKKYGPNALIEKKKTSIFERFFSQFKDFMIIILIIASVISIFLNEVVDAIIILTVIIINAVLGVIQESKAEGALEALKKMSAPNAKVLRNGQKMSIPASELVTGDIIFIEAGDLVPADARLIEAVNLKAEESSLTGESVPVEKNISAINKEDVALGDMKNMIFFSSIITYGRGIAIVTETGMSTQVGKIADMLQNEEDEITPLQLKLEEIGKFLGIAALAICAVIFIIGVFENKEIFEMFLTSISLAVAAIPEGLPAVVTIVLAVGVQRLVKQNAIIRRLPAVETLGSASVICSDKTGTLTQNRMTVVKTYVGGKLYDFGSHNFVKNSKLLEFASLCNDGQVLIENGKEKHIGDPTETALVAAALKAGIEKSTLEHLFPRLNEIPFDSERKMMTTIHNIDGKFAAVVKGAPDVLLSHCVGFEGLEDALQANQGMGRQALRVLAVGVRYFDEMPKNLSPENIENKLQFVGLLGMIDPPREEVKQAVELCRIAGIRPVMITGDHIETAMAIAKELGILRIGDKALTGTELSKMSDEELYKHIREYSVFARVAPEHKVRIVNAWQKEGEIVAMTGDGVNDAPALKSADIGCAMGITGTDVAKGAAHMVLTDDNFATIVVAVKEGRGIFKNIMRSIQFLLSSNLGEIFTILTSIVMRWATPLLPMHLLWVNLVTDSLPALALGMEPVDDNVMKQKPRRKSTNVFSNGFGLAIGFQGLMIGALTVSAFIIGRIMTNTGFEVEIKEIIAKGFTGDVGITMSFVVLSMSELFHAFNLKSDGTIFRKGFFKNKYMIYAFLIGMALQLSVMLIEPLRKLFKLAELEPAQWLIVFALSAAPIVIVEISKFIIPKFKKFIMSKFKKN